MAIEAAERLWSAQEFLEWESAQPYKYELIDNRIYPMPGGSRTHENIIAALISLLFFALYDKEGDVYAGGMKVQVDELATYTYPDVTVVSGVPRFHLGAKSGPLVNPTLLFEVLSPSTEKIDRTRKLEQYLRIPSLQGYFLVAQDEPLIEAYTRVDAEWIHSERAGLQSSLQIPAINCVIPLSEVYRRVDFANT